MTNNLYKMYKNQIDKEYCYQCAGTGRVFDHDHAPTEQIQCEECVGTGLTFCEDYQRDKAFFLNLLKVLKDEKWAWGKGLRDIIELNPAAQIIEMEHQDDSYMIVFRSHACYIEDGELKKFF